MNREIKFRGRSRSTGEWLYGDLLRNTNGDVAVVPPFKTDMSNECSDYEVDPDTVGQFTGLHDRNGKEIYEGDIMRMSATELNAEIIGDVRYESDGFVVESRLSSWSSTLAWICRKRQIGEPMPDIIGNVTDNPSLLEGEIYD